jgi:hypothetical protein
VDFLRSNKALHRLNDIICLENGLSIIKDPKPSKGHYGTWLGSNKKPSSREQLKMIIDNILKHNPSTFDDFIKMLEAENCEFKHSRRSVRLPGMKGFIRLNGLSNDYTEDTILERISGKRKARTKQNDEAEQSSQLYVSSTPKDRGFSLLIDVQNSIKAQNSPGYERWAKIFSLKQAAKTLIFLQDNNLDDLGKLSEVAQKAKDDFNALQTRIHAISSRLDEISNLQKHIASYSKTRDIYTEYKRRKYSKKFYLENEKAIEDCKKAKAFFDEQKLEKLPTIKSLKQEYAKLLAEKKTLHAGYHPTKNHMQEILIAQQNCRMLLNYRDTEPQVRDVRGIR